ncbi:MAG: TetR/AcrR family transcriptional regulator [Deltaproteobacteria bacterium]|nr:TetR/AcrR family transcriptional regulator [Deltaproteobacteria bacterium]
MSRPAPQRDVPMAEAILRATLVALEQHGEAGIRVMDIARAVGCSVGILYHHYGDREGLIRAAWARQFEGLLEADTRMLYEAFERCQTVEEFRGVLLRASEIGGGPERREMRRKRIGVLGAAWRRPALEQAIGRVQADRTTELQRAVELAQQRGFISREVSARTVATFTQAYTLGRILSDIDAEGLCPDGEWSALAHRFLLSLVQPG